MKWLFSLVAIVLFGSHAVSSESVSGLVVPSEDGGICVRNSEGEWKVEWTDETKAALQVNTRQFANLAISEKVDVDADLARAKLSDPKALSSAAWEVVENFLEAKNIVERAAFVRSPETVLPLMEKYYGENPDAPTAFRTPDKPPRMAVYKEFVIVLVELKDLTVIPVGVVRQLDGSLKVDWESFVGHCQIPWAEIKSQRSTEPFLVRARASQDDYYNFGFKGDDWLCVRLESADGEHVFYAYAELYSEEMLELQELLKSGDRMHLALEVAYPKDGKADNQLLVTGGIQRGWVAPREPARAAMRLDYHVPFSRQVIHFKLPAGPITAVVPVNDVVKAKFAALEESWIEERGLRLFFDEKRTSQQPSAEEPRFVGEWEPLASPRMLRLGCVGYELSLKKGGQSDAFLFNILNKADCKPFINRATVIGRKKDGVVIAEEVHLTPIGDQAAFDDPQLPRFLSIGDSISANYGAGLRDALRGKLNVHHPPTNCGPSSKGAREIVEWLGAHEVEGRDWDVIAFNFGHWDAGNDRATYKANLEVVIRELQKTGAKLVWVTTCPVPEGNSAAEKLTADGKAPGRRAGVMKRYLNPWAAEVIERYPEISICDQWQFVSDDEKGLFKEWWPGKDVHFRGEAAKALGKFLAAHVLEISR